MAWLSLISAEPKGARRCLLILWHRVRIGPEETFTVEMDEVVGGFGDPDF